VHVALLEVIASSYAAGPAMANDFIRQTGCVSGFRPWSLTLRYATVACLPACVPLNFLAFFAAVDNFESVRILYCALIPSCGRAGPAWPQLEGNSSLLVLLLTLPPDGEDDEGKFRDY